MVKTKNDVILAFDSVTYNLEVNNKDDINIYVPKCNIVKGDVAKTVDENVFSVVDTETIIRLHIKTNVETVPTVNIVSEDEDVVITTVGSLNLIANSAMVVTFSTIDGGKSWLVTSCNEAENTADGAAAAAKQAVEIATEAKGIAETANETSNQANSNSQNAVSTANVAKTNSETAEANSTQAKSTAATASVTADTAKNTADAANVTAEGAKTTADSASDKVDALEVRIQTLENKVASLISH